VIKKLTPAVAAAAALAFGSAALADSYPSQKPGPYPGAKNPGHHPSYKSPSMKHPGAKHPGAKHPSQKHPSYKSPGYSSHGAPGYSGNYKWGPGNSGK
jgi:hypothetical protein